MNLGEEQQIVRVDRGRLLTEYGEVVVVPSASGSFSSVRYRRQISAVTAVTRLVPGY